MAKSQEVQVANMSTQYINMLKWSRIRGKYNTSKQVAYSNKLYIGLH